MSRYFYEVIKLKQIELLAPAGNFEALKAAVESGANAVYLAGNHFGARAFANNFTNDELINAVNFAHLRDASINVTVNTIVSDSELDSLKSYLKFLNDIKVDAILVQDLGVAKIAKQIVPDLPLHASTQMTVHSLEGVKFLQSIGFDRVVLSRELSLNEIKYICDNSSVEIEVFMHGALCVCYSGQCLMSSMIGARSGNRGKCAQPCRLPYDLVDIDGNILENVGKYLLSPKDLNTLNLIPQLINVGVDSLKIEGRMKRPEYVAVVVETYRHIIDNNPLNDSNKRLAQIFNRDFTTAYLQSNQGKNLISDMKPNNRGLLIGRISSVNKNSITIKLTDNINHGDQLEIWIKVGGRLTITVDDFKLNNDLCTITVENTKGIKLHDRVFKVFDSQLTEHARTFFKFDKPIRKFDIDVEFTAHFNQPAHLKLIDDSNIAEVESKICTAQSKTQPLTQETVLKQLSRLGNTIFKINSSTINIDDNIMLPISELNDMRRNAIKILEDFRLNRKIHSSNHSSVQVINKTVDKKSSLIVHVDSLDKLNSILNSDCDSIIFGGETFNHQTISLTDYQNAINLVHSVNKKIFIATSRIIRESEQSSLIDIINSISNADSIYVHNVATLNLIKRISNLPIHSDFSLIAFNSSTIEFLSQLGIESVTLSPELTLEQIKNLKSNVQLECIVHGRIELMISQYCAVGSFIGGVGEHKCNQPCTRQKYFLKDRMNVQFPIVTDQFCRMHILNSKSLSMLPHTSDFKRLNIAMRIDGRYFSNVELNSLIKKYRSSINGDTVNEDFDFTRGHYFRGV